MNHIRLQLNGTVLTDCDRRAQRFCLPYPAGDGSYQTYDSVHVPQDNTVRLEEVALTVAVNSFIAGRQLAIIEPYLPRIAEALSRVPAVVALEHSDGEIPWDSLRDLFLSFPDQEFRTPRITKILHKKRPALIPMLDNVLIDRYFGEYEPRVKCLPEPEKCVEVMRLFRNDLIANLSTLNSIQVSLARAGNQVTPVRLLELLMWDWLKTAGAARLQGL